MYEFKNQDVLYVKLLFNQYEHLAILLIVSFLRKWRLQTILTIPRASTLDSVREWPQIFPDFDFFGFSSDRFCTKKKGLFSHVIMLET